MRADFSQTCSTVTRTDRRRLVWWSLWKWVGHCFFEPPSPPSARFRTTRSVAVMATARYRGTDGLGIARRGPRSLGPLTPRLPQAFDPPPRQPNKSRQPTPHIDCGKKSHSRACGEHDRPFFPTQRVELPSPRLSCSKLPPQAAAVPPTTMPYRRRRSYPKIPLRHHD